MDLNKSQQIAVCHKDGAMMVLAGPGSGKTTVITRRVLELIKNGGVAPENILVITFTRAAAAEMKERFERLAGGGRTAVSFGTFHAVFFKILKYAYSYDSSNIITEDGRFALIRDIMRNLGVDMQDEREFVGAVATEISKVKGEEIEIKHYYATSCSAADFTKIFTEYEKQLRGAGKIDFEDMLLMCRELLAARPDILAFWQDRYRYILIDEFQDINLLQYKIVKMLAAPQNNIFIVGDDDQSVYGFRGARPQIMLNFGRDYPGAKRVLLDINYRCGSDITQTALRLIGHNRNRFDKAIKARGDSEGLVSFFTFRTVSDQNRFIVRKVLDLMHGGQDLSKTAVLYRMNVQPRALAAMLHEYNINFSVSDSLPCVFDHWIASNFITYMKLAAGSRDRGLFLQIANRPKRYISREVFTKKEMTFREIYSECRDRPYCIGHIDKLRYDLEFMKCLDPLSAIRYIRNRIGYDDYLREYAEYRHMNPDELFETAAELEESAKGCSTLDEWLAYMDEYRESMKAAAGERDRKQKKAGKESTDCSDTAVRLMTFHSAKGLEFDNVFIIDANEGLTPHSRAEVPEDIEEERRMFYVAMTRAKERLYVLSERERFGKEMEISRFVEEAKGE